MPFTYESRLTPDVCREILKNRSIGHVLVMSAFRIGVGPEPRASLGVLWHLDSSQRVLKVQSKERPERPELWGEQLSAGTTEIPPIGSTFSLSLSTNPQKTPPSQIPSELRETMKNGKAYRSKMIIVPQAELTKWAQNRLRRMGFIPEPEGLALGPIQRAYLGPGKSLPQIDLNAQGRISDASDFSAAVFEGTGKGKNYGLGLIRITT